MARAAPVSLRTLSRAQTQWARVYILYSYCFVSIWAPKPGAFGLTKNPRLTGNRGFLENSILSWLEVPSHDCAPTSGAVPQGRLSHDPLVANANLNSHDHLLTCGNIYQFPAVVKSHWPGI